ncbi:MAG TPA: DUF1549 domain-containing protein [Planctomycetota bacterium]|nr:DUF1549 domain-containing protein [Planctomycetota bacterium]
MRTLALAGILVLGHAAPQEGPDPVAALINRHLDARWAAEKIAPAAPADDYEYFRRLSLDVLGRPPKPDEVRAFVADKSKGKRAAAIDAMLGSDEAARYFADRWMRLLFGFRLEETDPLKVDFPAFTGWLVRAWKEDLPYDRFETDLVAATGEKDEHPEMNFILRYLDPKEPPVALSSRAARVFLGLQIQCAQCHDHPSEPFTQEDFWGLAAHFGNLKQKTRKTFDGIRTKLHQELPATVKISADAEHATTPRFLDGTSPPDGTPPREWLAKKILEYGDGQFARAAVNRVWRHFMGLGFVEPVDRFSSRSEPIHPDLFRALAEDFRAGGYRMRRLSRGILLSKAYGLGSKRGAAPDREFSFKLLKPQDPPQVLNSLVWTLNLDAFLKTFYDQYTSNKDLPEGYKNPEVFRQYLFLFVQNLLAPGRRAPEENPYAGSVRLALKLMNGHDLQGLMKAGWGRLAEVLKSEKEPAARVDLLYLTLLARPPDGAERARVFDHLKRRREPAAFEDLFWVLVNSTEFFFNH